MAPKVPKIGNTVRCHQAIVVITHKFVHGQLTPEEVSNTSSVFESLDPKVQEQWNIQGELKNALLGYATLDLVQHANQLVFGTWNPRPLQSKQVQRLVESFENGLDRFDLKSVIPVVIQKSSIDLASLSLDPSDLSQLTALKLLPKNEGMSIKCAGGRHRTVALKNYLTIIKNRHDNFIQQSEHLADDSEEVDISHEESCRFEKDLDAIKKMQNILNRGGRWMVAVYDEGSPHLLIRSRYNS